MSKVELFAQLEIAIASTDSKQKCRMATELATDNPHHIYDHQAPVKPMAVAGLPRDVKLVAPRNLKKRGLQTQAGRTVLMHAIAHIEFNAINLAFDAAYRFRHQPNDYYADWLKVAADEARHFQLINDYLQEHGRHYGAYPAHNGLWEIAEQTQHDIIARLALVPRVLEARGLDVTPTMIEKLNQFGDYKAAKILKVIYDDEINHVAIGSKWFRYHCDRVGLSPEKTFFAMINRHLHGDPKGPFNRVARMKAGFSESELIQLSAR